VNLLTIGSQQVGLDLVPQEILLFHSALGEVCYGFSLPDFESAIGVPESRARALFETLRHLSPQQSAHIQLTKDELHILENALRETLRELGPEEFHIRTGVEFESGEAALRELETYTTALGSRPAT
jgi:hypothetical protein